mmetsp:Transcript_19290/g.40219  ORF Transcript_19290/g.40219 Transcript_19290/m.40219 type:complete len:213 (+) Transcript_19290:300-938(+)|eukprot:CAMPEP_0118644666 /NCGR_PEP_ID=MMETSP0785-20121206/7069_1 /TAXON_ID=91992 /ORGANISM="Bolidomonas pacifica, Strain CCMP 1866" /LENGTH=212 /DNA_ID=CAMNT_0006536457 /DNA_START=252 /DNA_END=890 /DNA_ORIENTATION=-
MAAIVANSFLSLEGLTQADVTQIAESSILFIKNGFSSSVATSSAKALSKSIGLSTSQCTMAITAVAKIFSESANRGHNEQFFVRSLTPFAVGEHVRKALSSVYLANQKLIYQSTPDRGSSTRSYSDLSWNLSIEVSRRSSLNCDPTPNFSVSVSTTGGGEGAARGAEGAGGSEGTIDFVCSPAEMLRMREEINRALEEEKGQHSQRFQRYLN